MPVLTASAPRSSSTASIFARSTAGGVTCTDATPALFCTVMAVTAVIANAPSAVAALMSACSPAPPPASEPALDSRRGTLRGGTGAGSSAAAAPM